MPPEPISSTRLPSSAGAEPMAWPNRRDREKRCRGGTITLMKTGITG